MSKPRQLRRVGSLRLVGAGPGDVPPATTPPSLPGFLPEPKVVDLVSHDRAPPDPRPGAASGPGHCHRAGGRGCSPRFLPLPPRRRARAQPPVSLSPDPATESPLHTAAGGHQPLVERRSSSSVNSRVERRSSSSVNSRVKLPRAPPPRRRSPRVPAAAVEMSRQSHRFQ
ncbi:hypothetical protein BRADI_1g08505v3 [Brachypodium distachyon]|uniref:Uncharacterized protein n=1 Tax=Brachypodium distachyon TaxID=15368 RepID=A0A0Q3JMA5_BRADI|nr:hypothetical protein BRADI_1g08505v3 [Brachypodium distachyon]